jgi:chromate transport protein ChrA
MIRLRKFWVDTCPKYERYHSLLDVGILLLATLTWLVAKRRGASATAEILKHLTIAAVVIVASRAIGTFVAAYTQ